QVPKVPPSNSSILEIKNPIGCEIENKIRGASSARIQPFNFKLYVSCFIFKEAIGSDHPAIGFPEVQPCRNAAGSQGIEACVPVTVGTLIVSCGILADG